MFLLSSTVAAYLFLSFNFAQHFHILDDYLFSVRLDDFGFIDAYDICLDYYGYFGIDFAMILAWI